MAASVDTSLANEISVYSRLREIWKHDIESYAKFRLGLNPTWQQRIIFNEIVKPSAKVSVRSGHGIGKDGSAACIILWFLETHDYSRCACTAPSSHQLRDVLWGELAKWRRKADALSARREDHPNLWLGNLFKLNQDTLCDYNAPLEWYAIARTARKENPEALQGLHASDVDIDDSGMYATALGDASLLFIIDEASGVPDVVYEVSEGARSTPNSRELLIGNPTKNTGFFAASHKHLQQEYTALHFKSHESPLVDPEYRDGLARRYGEDSNVVRVRCDGEFPKLDDDALISVELTEAALIREYDKSRKPQGLKRLGIDVARGGKDRTTFVCRHDFLVPFIDVKSKQETMTTVGQALMIGESLQVDDIAVDAIGLGVGVYDRLVEVMSERRESGMWHCTVTGVNVALASPEKDANHIGQAAKLRDWLWVEAERWLRDDEPCFVAENREYCETLAGELSSPTWKPDSNGNIKVESKDEMRARLAKNGSSDFAPSPDLADGLCCTFAPIKHEPVVIAPVIEIQASKWR